MLVERKPSSRKAAAAFAGSASSPITKPPRKAPSSGALPLLSPDAAVLQLQNAVAAACELLSEEPRTIRLDMSNVEGLGANGTLFCQAMSKWEETQHIRELYLPLKFKGIGMGLDTLTNLKTLVLSPQPRDEELSPRSTVRSADLICIFQQMVSVSCLEEFAMLGVPDVDPAARTLAKFLARSARTLRSIDLSHSELGPPSLAMFASVLVPCLDKLSPLRTNIILTAVATYEARVQFFIDLFRPIIDADGSFAIDQLPATEEHAAAVLQLAQNVTKFQLSNTNLQHFQAGLPMLVKTSSKLQALVLNGNNLTTGMAQDIVHAIGHSTTLQSLEFRDNPCHVDTVLSDVCRVLRASRKSCLQHVAPINDELRVTLLVRTDIMKPDVDLPGRNLTAADMKLVGPMLRANRTATSVNFGFNHIGDEGVRIVCEALAANEELGKLTDLDLSEVGLTDAGAHHVADLIRSHPSLMSVCLVGNAITAKGAAIIRAAMDANAVCDTVDLAANDVADTVLTEMAMSNVKPPVVPTIRAVPIVEVKPRSGRQLAPEVGGIISSSFGASILVQPNDMIGGEVAAALGPPPKSLANVNKPKPTSIPVTIGMVTEKGRLQLPRPPKHVELTGATTEVLPHGLGFSRGAVLRLYHGLVGSKQAGNGFRVLYFGGYSAMPTPPTTPSGSPSPDAPTLTAVRGAALVAAEASSPAPEVAASRIHLVEDEDTPSSAAGSGGGAGARQVDEEEAGQDDTASEAVRARQRARGELWTLVAPSRYRIKGSYVEVVIPQGGIYSPAWDFRAGPALVRANVLVFGPAHGWGMGEGDIPMLVVVLPDPQDPGVLQADQLTLCARMQARDPPMSPIGGTTTPMAIDLGRTLKCRIGNSIHTLPKAWHNVTQEFKLFKVPPSGALGTEHCDTVFIFRVDGSRKRVADPSASVPVRLPIVSRLPPTPDSFKLVTRTRHSTTFEWKGVSEFEDLSSGLKYNLYMAQLTMDQYSHSYNLLRSERKREGSALTWEKYWTGEGTMVEIDNEFYAAVFKITSENRFGESGPSNLVLVDPSSKYADDRLKLGRAVRKLEAVKALQAMTGTPGSLEDAMTSLSQQAGGSSGDEIEGFSATADGDTRTRTPERQLKPSLSGSSSAFSPIYLGRAHSVSSPALPTLDASPIISVSQVDIMNGSTVSPTPEEHSTGTKPAIPADLLRSPIRRFPSGRRRADGGESVGNSPAQERSSPGGIPPLLTLAGPDTGRRSGLRLSARSRPLSNRSDVTMSQVVDTARSAATSLGFTDKHLEVIASMELPAVPERGNRRGLLAELEEGILSRDFYEDPSRSKSRLSALSPEAGSVTARSGVVRAPKPALPTKTPKEMQPPVVFKAAEPATSAALTARSAATARVSMSFTIPHLPPGIMQTAETMVGMPAHQIVSENRRALTEAVEAKDMWTPEAFQAQFGFPSANVHFVLSRMYPDMAQRPFIALMLCGLDRLQNVAAAAYCNLANAQRLAALYRDNFIKCGAGKHRWQLIRRAPRFTWLFHTAFVAHYAELVGVFQDMLRLLRDIHGFLQSLSSPGWLKLILKSRGITAQFHAMDKAMVQLFQRCRLAAIQPALAAMSLSRKYADESEVHALSVVFIESMLLQGVGSKPTKGTVPELALQLNVPASVLFQEVHHLFRAAAQGSTGAHTRSKRHVSTKD